MLGIFLRDNEFSRVKITTQVDVLFFMSKPILAHLKFVFFSKNHSTYFDRLCFFISTSHFTSNLTLFLSRTLCFLTNFAHDDKPRPIKRDLKTY